jgi:UDP-N-acetylglucosamine--N-acetylmuramyl-(pentapeptide) pyrophosphoryl-undecaprenol N-acetylglucosamine transferase
MKKRTGDSFHHCWVGSKRGMDRSLVEKAGVEFYGIPAGKLRRYLSLSNILDVFKVAAGIARAFFLLRRLQPVVVFSKGGYVTVPVVLAARFLRIPAVSHESDAEPGLATRINSRFSNRILVSFSETVNFIPEAVRGKVEVSGNPVRSSLFSGNKSRGLEKAGHGTKPVLLVLGGSQGARQINTLIEACLESLLAEFRIVHQHGSWDDPPEPVSGYLPFDFIGEDLADFIAAAEIVVCRAGASTLWELAALGKPSVLIPLGTGSSRGDQQTNARIFAERGASVVLTGDVSPEQLQSEVSALMKDTSRLETMAQAAKRLAERNGSEYISIILLEEIKNYGRISDN